MRKCFLAIEEPFLEKQEPFPLKEGRVLEFLETFPGKEETIAEIEEMFPPEKGRFLEFRATFPVGQIKKGSTDYTDYTDF